jgi:hypothetical protein
LDSSSLANHAGQLSWYFTTYLLTAYQPVANY